ncbi:sigma-70 family RNA polymerase sigma factor [Actinomycetospora soli]|uniref:sigma-70 family RNA polymerase sigma factor n=1 Tax=Actinomycetospora soli TaxID=2893887 RepID=UPI001E3B600D|nr:sigma-70 family RNA polymerase sigma factor [Actinomycetospora soli]MCD2190995.1 sigma-70 family RNA polymerase sigma factor [Actinomycetospora soli]
MSTRTRTEDNIAGETPRLSDEELEAFDVDAAFANVDFSDPSADAADLRSVTAAADALDRSRDALEAAVRAARAHGRSWARIGGLLGVTRQAAQQRFGHVDPSSA